MSRILPLVLVLAMCIIGTTQGCSCVPDDLFPQKLIRADYAIVARVEDNGQVIGEMRVYTISRLLTFKTSIPWPQVNQTHIYTPEDGATCGITLTQGKVSLVTGSFSGPTDNPNVPLRFMQAYKCDIQKRWDWMLGGTIARLQRR